MNIKILIISCFLLLGCKNLSDKKNQNFQYTGNCFYRSNDYVYLNFYNSSNEDVYIPAAFLFYNNDGTLQNHYYKLINDTLYLRTIDKDDVSISDAINPNIKVINDTIAIKPGKRIQKTFKSREAFQTIVLKNKDDRFTLQNCVKH